MNHRKIAYNIIILILLLLLLIASVIAGAKSFGWFSSSRTLYIDNGGFSIVDLERPYITDCCVVKYDLVNHDSVIIPAVIDDYGSYHLSVEMNPYDSIFTQRNVYAPIVIKIDLESGHYRPGDPISIKIDRDQGQISGVCLSDVIFIMMDIASPETDYLLLKNHFEGENFEKLYFTENSVECILSYQESKSIYIYIEYDPERIRENIQTNSLTTIIPLEDDIVSISVK